MQKHILSGWNIFSSQLGEFIDVIPAQQRIGSDWYRGTADAIYQNAYTIADHDPKLALILAGDHIYKMDYDKLIGFHRMANADMTVSCVPMPISLANQFGVIEVDEQNCVCGFQEKPKNPKTIPEDPKRVFASMGIYLFNTKTLLEELEIDAKNITSEHDFGKNVIPQMLKRNKRVYVYNFIDDENQPQYWRDIGTRDAYYLANMDLIKRKPEFDLYDKAWPVRTYHAQYPPLRMTSYEAKKEKKTGAIIDSVVSGGCVINGGKIERSVLSSNVHIQKDAHIADSILMEGVIVGENSQIRNAIIDKEVIIPAYSKIGFDLKSDKKQFDVTTSGVVIVAKKTSIK